MSKNPRVQAKIKAELGDNKYQHLSIEQLDSLEYLNCVLQEVLRFGPPVSLTVRNLTNDDRLQIDPDLFYPERFQGEDKDHHPYASIPFGGGHRQCIGQDLARLALKAIMARLMQHVTFGDGGPEVNAGGHSWRITLTPKNVGVTITFD
ncbi:unnamed protein product [Rotaria sordida]|uniref:Cytochrome P450 n=1 Tax=Rotaria sordida TaxID=392033 RepID=A0A819ULP9_9BILA|nr:unnamed protein product [Rotaria sordida]